MGKDSSVGLFLAVVGLVALAVSERKTVATVIAEENYDDDLEAVAGFITNNPTLDLSGVYLALEELYGALHESN